MSYKQISPREFLRGIDDGIAFTPPFCVKGLSPRHIAGYNTWKNAPDPVDKELRQHLGVRYVWPPSLKQNPWSAFTGGILFERWGWAGDDQTIDVYVTDGASSGTGIIVGTYQGRKVIKNQSASIYSSNYAYSPPMEVSIRLEFKIAERIPSYDGPPTAYMSAPYGTFSRPKSGEKHIGNIEFSVNTRSHERVVSYEYHLRSPGGIGINFGTSGSKPRLEEISNGWAVYINSRASLGTYSVTGTVVTDVGGKRWTVDIAPSGGSFEVIKEGGSDIIIPGPTPDPPPVTPDPPVPIPVIVEKWALKTEETHVVAVGDESGEIKWSTETKTGASGEVSVQSEVIPGKTISSYLRPPSTSRQIEKKSIRRTFTASDKTSVQRLGEISKKLSISGIDSWGALKQYAERELLDASRCVVGTVEVPCNPLMSPGDTLSFPSDYGPTSSPAYVIERIVHDLTSWTSIVTIRRAPQNEEISSIVTASTEQAETAIIKTIKEATTKVDNAKEARVVARIDNSTYDVQVTGETQTRRVKIDRAIVGDLLPGMTVLVGRGSR